jgi:hypothetical protein
MKTIIFFTLFICIHFSYSQVINSPENEMPPDILIRLLNYANTGNFTICVKKTGTIFSGDNFNPSTCPPEKKVYSDKYIRRNIITCLNEQQNTILGNSATFEWESSPQEGPAGNYDYIAHGKPRDTYSWLGFGLYQVILTDHSSGIAFNFYLDFGDSKLREPPGSIGSDLRIDYDMSKPINSRVKINVFASGTGVLSKIIQAETGKVYRVWNELKSEPNIIRNGVLFLNGTIPLTNLSSDTLFSPGIIDINTTLSSGKSINIDPFLYPEPQKLTDLKLTINNGITLNAENSSTLIVGDGAEISLGSGSIINIATGGNLFIGSNSKWTINPTSQVNVSGNFKITSKIPNGWQILSVPNFVSNFAKVVVWANAASPAYAFENGNVEKPIL